jgi:hypothetical protein
MTDHQITLRISDAVYARAQRIAEQTAQPVEQVLTARLVESFDVLNALPQDERGELSAFQQLSDDTLFGIVGEQASTALKERMRLLGERTSRGTISADDAAEYAALVERGNRLLLRKAWAANVLMNRGHRVSPQDFAPSYE